MQKALTALDNRLKPFEEFFFTTLTRVFLAATLVGSAWIDDAPPLELAAYLISAYVGIRLITQFPTLMDVAPFGNKVLKVLVGLVSILVLVFSFIVVADFVSEIAFLVITD